MVIKCENLQLHSRGLSYSMYNTGDTYVVTLFRIPGMAHNVFVNEHIVMLADSFTRKRAMHINIAKVIFSVENTTWRYYVCCFPSCRYCRISVLWQKGSRKVWVRYKGLYFLSSFLLLDFLSFYILYHHFYHLDLVFLYHHSIFRP